MPHVCVGVQRGLEHIEAFKEVNHFYLAETVTPLLK